MIETITGALTGVGAALEITKSMLAIKVDSAVSAKVAELDRIMLDIMQKLLTSQTEQSTLLSRVRELEAEIAHFEDWESETQRYELKELVPGTLVYRLKPGMENKEPVHDLCPHCYQQGIKSILQDNGFDKAWHVFICPHCKTIFRGAREPMTITTVPRSNRYDGF
jgi:Zn finger protein HypA/HybF involved in hydrogenase expression